MSKNFRIVNPNKTVEGKSISEWTEQWWKWVLELPADETNPLNDEDGTYASLDNDRDVFFIAGPKIVTVNPGEDPGNIEDNVIVREFDVPFGKSILFPILNILSFDLEKDPLSFYLDRFEGMYARIDGKDINNVAKRFDVDQINFQLGPAEEGTMLEKLIIEDSAAGDPDATYHAGADGYWLMLDKVSEGEHTLEFGGYLDLNDNSMFDEGDIRLAASNTINVVKSSDDTCPFDADTLPAVDMLIA